MMRANSAGTAGFRRVGGTGARFRIASKMIPGLSPRNGQRARRRLVEHHPEREHSPCARPAARRGPAPATCTTRCPACCPDRSTELRRNEWTGPRRRRVRRGCRLCEAEIQNLRPACRQEDVRGLEVVAAGAPRNSETMNVSIAIMWNSLDRDLNRPLRGAVTFGDERPENIAEPRVIDSKQHETAPHSDPAAGRDRDPDGLCAEPHDLFRGVARERPHRAGARDSQAECLGHVHAGAGASRRRDQRALRAVHPWNGVALRRRAEQPWGRRAERDRPGAVPRHRRPAHRGAGGRSSHRRRGAVLHARDRLRLLVRSRGSHQQVGARRDHRRLREAHSRVAS